MAELVQRVKCPLAKCREHWLNTVIEWNTLLFLLQTLDVRQTGVA